MKQVKIFRDMLSLEGKVNEFLKDLDKKSYSVVDIQYTTCYGNSEIKECVIIIYNKPSE